MNQTGDTHRTQGILYTWTATGKRACALVFGLGCLLLNIAAAEHEFAVRIPNKPVKVGFFTEPGFHESRRSEPSGGYGYDYLQHIRQYAPWKYEYACGDRGWAEAFRMLENGEIDLLSNVQKTPEREVKFAFSKYPMGQSSAILTVKNGCTRFRKGDYAHWNGIRVGILNNNSSVEKFRKFAVQKGLEWNAVWYDNATTMLDDLQAGSRIDAVLSHNLRRLSNEWVLEELGPEPFYIAVRKDKPELLNDLNAAQAQMAIDEPELAGILRQRYFSVAYNEIRQYSEDESEFLRQMKLSGRKFKAVLNPDRYPLSYFADGEPRGILREIANEIIRRSGLNIEFLPTRTPEEYQQALSNPEVDFIFAERDDLRTAEKNGLVLSNPYLTLKAFLVSNKDAGNKLRRLALTRDYQISKELEAMLPRKVRIQYCNDTNEALRLVKSGKCDATCLYTAAAGAAVNNDPYERLSAQVIPQLEVRLAVGTRDDRNPLLASIIGKSVSDIRDDFIINAIRKHSVPRVFTWSPGKMLHRYPVAIWSITSALLLILCGFLWFMLRTRRKAYQLGVVFSKMPFRYFFADAKGNLLQYSYGSEEPRDGYRTLDDVPDEKIRLPMQKMVANALRENMPQEGVYTDAGHIRAAIVSPVPKSIFGRPAVIGISRDITDLQHTHDEARRNEEYCRLTLQSIGDGVIATDKRGCVTMLNPAAEHIMGVSLDHALGKPHTRFFKIVCADDSSEVESPVLRTLRTGGHVEPSSHTDLISFDGKKRYHITNSSSPIRNDRGEIIGAILVFRDVTDEYNRRHENQSELAKWEAASRIAEIYHFSLQPQTRKIQGSKELSKVWPSENGVALAAKEWICPEDYPEWEKKFSAIVSGELLQATVKYRIRKSGGVRYFRGFLRGTMQKNGEIIGLIQEVTSFVVEKQKQNALQTLWATCREIMPITMFLKSANDDFRYRQCNSSFARFLGMKEQDIIGKTDAELLRRPEDAAFFRKCDSEIMEGGKAVELHEAIMGGDGRIHHFRTVKIPSTGLDGAPVLLGMSLDETEDYLRQEKLNHILDDWETVANVARLASYRMDRNMRILSSTGRVTEFWPLEPDGLPLPPEEYLRAEDVPLYRNMYEKVFNGIENNATMLCHVPHPDGTRYLRLFIKRDVVKPDEITGLIQDVTEQISDQKKRETLLTMWRNVVDTLPVMFFVKNADDDMRFVQVNEKFARMAGVKNENIVGQVRPVLQCYPDEIEHDRKNDRLTLESGTRQDFMDKRHIATGELRQFRTVKIPSVDENGHRIIISMSQDVTVEQELSETRRIISAAFETLYSSDHLSDDLRIILKNVCEFIGFERAYICCVDEATNGIRVYASYHQEGMEPMFNLNNFRIEHASTLPWYAKLAGSVRDNVFRFDFSDRHDLEQAQCHVPMILKRAEKFDVRGVHVNYISVKGKPWGCLGFITCGQPVKKLSDNKKRLLKLLAHMVELSITRKRTLDQLKKALSEALTADKAKNYFLSSMSHEIRTPLNAVIGFTDLLKDRDLDMEMREDYLNAIEQSSHALLTLLNDILELSKLASGTSPMHPVRTDMKKFIEELDSMFRTRAEQKRLTLEFLSGPMPVLYLDQSKLRQILFNLISNAIKFTHAGGVKAGFVFTGKTPESGELTMEVIDTGIGIEPEDREKMFEPFIQMSRMRGTNASGNGTGLGLAIVKKSVEQMGGTLSLESEVGSGSSFKIVLPGIRLEPENKPDSANKSDGQPAEPQNLRVLIVDDSEMALNILSKMLSWLQVPHTAVRSGREALDCLKKEYFDLLMTDILMPDMNGAELAEIVRATPGHKDMRIFAMSTENDSIMYDKKLFDKVLLKPIVRNVLFDGIFGKNGESDEKSN